MIPFPHGVKRFAARAKTEGVRATTLRTARIMRDRPLISLRNAADSVQDKRIVGMSLEVHEPPTADGAIDTIQVPYGSLDAVFAGEVFTEKDVLLDVGCGMGRPLAYLVDKKFPGRLAGVEINPKVAGMAQEWAKDFPNVRIMSDDAFAIDLTPYTKFFLWRPLEPEAFIRFVGKMEAEIVHPVRLYYLMDTPEGDYMMKRPGWTLYRRDWVHRVHGIPQHFHPTRFSVWDFDPLQAAEERAQG